MISSGRHECLKNYGQRFIRLYSDQNHPQEKVMQEGKVVVWGGFTNSRGKKKSKRRRRKGKIFHTECGALENNRKTEFLMQRSRGKQRLEISSRKSEINMYHYDYIYFSFPLYFFWSLLYVFFFVVRSLMIYNVYLLCE